MKKYIASLLIAMVMLVGFAGVAEARSVRVKSYFNSRGTYVPSYYRSSPNRSRLDNWSAKGNYNPYTGKRGSRIYWY